MHAGSNLSFDSHVPPIQIVSTDSVNASERLDFWKSGGTFLFGALELEQDRDDHFEASLSHTRLGDLIFCRMTARVAHRAARTKAMALNDDRPYLKAVLQTKGRSVIAQNGVSTPLRSGQWTVYDAGEPYSAAASHGAEFSIILIPRAKVVGHGVNMRNLVLRPLSARSGFGKLIWTFLDMTMDQIPTVREHRTFDVAEVIAQMLRITLLDSFEAQSEENSRDALRERVKFCISAHLSDPDLSVSKLADLMRCSKRYLHMIFRPEDISISEYILKARLDRCRAQLLDPSCARRSITDIAYSWGFNNSNHFSRCFKREFGVSPRELRTDLGPSARFSRPVNKETFDAPTERQGVDRSAVH
jgi:AraC-like DNA-binding protein